MKAAQYGNVRFLTQFLLNRFVFFPRSLLAFPSRNSAGLNAIITLYFKKLVSEKNFKDILNMTTFLFHLTLPTSVSHTTCILLPRSHTGFFGFGTEMLYQEHGVQVLCNQSDSFPWKHL